jgi:hypothetical protein
MFSGSMKYGEFFNLQSYNYLQRKESALHRVSYYLHTLLYFTAKHCKNAYGSSELSRTWGKYVTFSSDIRYKKNKSIKWLRHAMRMDKK